MLVATTTGMLLTAFLFNPYTSIASSAATLITDYPVVSPGRRIKPSSPIIEVDSWQNTTAREAFEGEGETEAAPSPTDAVVAAIQLETITKTITAAPVETAKNASVQLRLNLPVEAYHDSAFFLKHNVVSPRRLSSWLRSQISFFAISSIRHRGRRRSILPR